MYIYIYIYIYTTLGKKYGVITERKRFFRYLTFFSLILLTVKQSIVLTTFRDKFPSLRDFVTFPIISSDIT